MVNYYAVRVGRNTGIYQTWKECEKNIKGYSKAEYKKFTTKEEAEKYIENLIINSQIVNDDYNFDNCINVYTDGSCINNGKSNAEAGCGIYFGINDKRNSSFKLKNKAGYNKTNNRAELKAILRAIKILNKEITEGKIIVIHTDSKYSIGSFTSNNLDNKVNQIPNYDYVIKGNTICKKNSNIKFHHIKAHTGKQDIHSIGNENADLLADSSLEKDIDNFVVDFGKYKNKSLDEIYKIDKDYLLWLLQNTKYNKNQIILFLEKKEQEQEQANKQENNKKKIYKLNGVRCILIGKNYYTYINNVKGEIFAFVNLNDEIELVE